METQKTYFEQIPVATVMKIARQFSVSEIGDRVPELNVSAAQDWREVAQRVQEETDSGKILGLVQELIEKYDEEKTQKCRSSATTNRVSDRPPQGAGPR